MHLTQCPKCTSQELYTVSVPESALFIASFTRAHLFHYACIECGYVESYLARQDDKDAIKREWTRVNT